MTNRTSLKAREDSWRKELFFAEIAQQSAAKRRATARRHAIVAGIVIGVLGSLAILLHGA
jgi:hypothetical protein